MHKDVRLLIVDDEVRFVQSLARRLQLRGFAVATALSGSEALLAAEHQPFDVVLLDLKMPGMNGEDVLDRLKTDYPNTEVIILTGHGSIDSAVKCTQAGSHSYLQKPCETELLLEAIKDAYQRRVARKLHLDEASMEDLLRNATGQGPLGILKHLQELERKTS